MSEKRLNFRETVARRDPVKSMSRSAKIVQNALQAFRDSCTSDFNSSSDAEKHSEIMFEVDRINSMDTLLKNSNKKVEKWLETVVFSTNSILESSSPDASDKCQQLQSNCLSNHAGFKQNIGKVMEKKGLFIEQSFNSDSVQRMLNPYIDTEATLNFSQAVTTNDLSLQYNLRQNSDINRRSNYMCLQPLQPVTDSKQMYFSPKSNNQEDKDLITLQPLQTDNSVLNTIQQLTEMNITSNNDIFDDEYMNGEYDHETDRDWEPSTDLESESENDENVLNAAPFNNGVVKDYKRTYCTFCESSVISKHFSRHLQQRHKEKRMVKLLLNTRNAKEKKGIIMTIRNKGNLKLKERNGTIIPKKRMQPFSDQVNNSNYMICAKCKTFLKSTYIVRHNRKCFVTNSDVHTAHPKVESFILSLESDYQEYIKKDPLRKQLIEKLRLDVIGKVVISDPIILEYGLQLLQTNKNIKKRTVVVRNKMRECARILNEFKNVIPESSDSITTIIDILKPNNIDYLVQAVKKACNYSESERSYGAASYALHQGKTLKDLIDIAVYLICKKDKIINSRSLDNAKSILDELKLLRKMIQQNWGRLVGSLALKDLNTNKSRNHAKKLLPLTEDVMKLRKYCIEKAVNAVYVLKNETNILQYTILVEVTFMLLLLHNRKRVGDIQYIELADVTKLDTTEYTDEVLQALSPTEQMLTKLYKKIHTIGKGSKDLLVLVPRDVQKFVNTLVTERIKYINSANKYFFPNCKGTDEWINGCYIQRRYSKECGAKLPELLRSSRLRKHIATMMQLMDLRDNEIGQVASFMGHTEKTHREFYRLPKDVLMIAKVSKILLKLEKGELLNCKNKRMDEIDIQIDEPEFSRSSSEEDEELKAPKNFSVPISSNETSIASQRNDPGSYKEHTYSALGCADEEETSKNIRSTKKSRQPVKTKWSTNENSVLASSDEEETSETTPPTKKSHQIEKKKWSSKETNLIKIHLKKYLDNNSLYPSAAEVDSFSKKYLTSKRSVAQVKSKIQYLKRHGNHM